MGWGEIPQKQKISKISDRLIPLLHDNIVAFLKKALVRDVNVDKTEPS